MLRASLILFVCSASAPESPVGTWKFKSVCPDGKQRECVVTIVKAGDVLKGTYVSDGVKRPAKGVSFARGVLTVEVDGQFAGQAYGVTYKGKPEGDRLSGTARWSYGWASGSFAFKGERLAQDAVADR